MSRSTEGKLVDIPLGSGMNQAGGTRGAQPGTLEYATNSRIRAAGRIERRCGSQAIAATSQGGGGARAVSDSSAIPRPTERPAFITSSGDVSLLGTTSGDIWFYDGTYHEFRGCFSSSRPVGRSTAIATSDIGNAVAGTIPATAVTASGYTLVACVTESLSVLLVITNPEGAVVYRGEGLSVAAANPFVRAVAQGDRLILVYHESGGALVRAVSHSIASGIVIVGSETTVLTMSSSAGSYDVTPYDSSVWYVAGSASDGGGGDIISVVEVFIVTPTGNTAQVVTTGSAKVSLWGDTTNDQLWVGYLDDPSGTAVAGFTVFPVPLAAATYPKTAILSSPSVDSESMPPLFGPRYSRAGANADAFFALGTYASSIYATRVGFVVSGTPSISHTQHHVSPVSKPDLQQRFWAIPDPIDELTPGQFLLLRFSEEPGDTGTLIVDMSTPLDVGHFALPPDGSFNTVAVVSEDAGASTFFALPTALTTATDASSPDSVQQCVSLYEYRRYNQEPIVGFALVDELIIAGQPTSSAGLATTTGTSKYNRGIGAFELGIPQIPRIFSATATPAGGGIPAGTYLYQALHVWIDRLGRKHISTPSSPLSVTLTVPSSVAVVVSGCTLGQRLVGSALQVATLLYRTVAGGQVPQLLPLGELGESATGVNTFTDTFLDAVVSENEFMPTAGGVLPVRLAPTCRHTRAAEERLWLGGLWDGSIIEASRIRVPGEPYHFTQDASHQVVLPADCTGLAYQDGQIVAFTERAIYLIGGDGPNDQGAGQFLPPRAYVSTIGCPSTESGSILETEIGIFFRSTSSWWIIPRGFGAPVDIGASIQDEPVHCIASAYTETSGFRLARFLVGATGDYSSDTVLVYHLDNGQWTRDTYAADIGTMGQWPTGLAMFRYDLDRVPVTGAVANVIRYEQEDVGADYDGTITQAIRTNWQYPFGMGGWGAVKKVLIAAESLTANGAQTLTVTVETDSNSYTPSAWATTGAEDPVYRGIDVKVTRCTCYRVTVQQSAEVPDEGGAYGEGLRFLSITAEIDSEQGIRLLAASGQKV